MAAPRASRSGSESSHRSRRLDLTFDQASGPPLDAGEPGRAEHSHPPSRQDSGSERSIRSQKSLDMVYFSKTFETQPGRPRSSNGHSHRSNGSVGGLSGASSVSDKAESVGSLGSRSGGKARLVTVGQSGSDGSQSPGREPIRLLGGLGGRSDDEDF